MRVTTTFVNTEIGFINNCDGLCYNCDKYGSGKCDGSGEYGNGYWVNAVDKYFNNVDMALESKRVR